MLKCELLPQLGQASGKLLSEETRRIFCVKNVGQTTENNFPLGWAYPPQAFTE